MLFHSLIEIIFAFTILTCRMKKYYSKRNHGFLKYSLILLIITSCIINGCRKDLTTINSPVANNGVIGIASAKAWYEKNYPIGGSEKSLHTSSINADISQIARPDWQHPSSYVRLGEDVIEMPIDAKSKFSSILKKKVNNSTYSKTYNQSSFLLLKGDKGYKAFIMTIIADSSYIKGNPAKLVNNTYQQHDVDFSGLVLYFTPKGEYVNGYAYKNGQVVTPSSQVQSSGKIQVQLAQVCTDWFWEVSVDGEVVSSTYLYTTCTGGDEGPGSGGTPPPANPCPSNSPPSLRQPMPSSLPGGNHLAVNQVPGGGFLPPDDNPCTIPTQPTTPHPIFGINNSNAVIPDANFDRLLSYLDSKGIDYTDPYNVILTIDGVEYVGQYTDIKNPDGTTVHYFSPDTNSGPFQIGKEYAIGPSDANSNIVNTTRSFNFAGIFIASPSSYLGTGIVTYMPSSGAILTPTQRQVLETADNNRLLQLLQQEDAIDDASVSPCHGTARNGNLKWQGTLEHWLIQFDYMASNPLALKEYYIPGSSGKLNSNPGYADIANPATGEIFEIKPDNATGQAAGTAEVQIYLNQANSLCPRVVGGGWSAGEIILSVIFLILETRQMS